MTAYKILTAASIALMANETTAQAVGSGVQQYGVPAWSPYLVGFGIGILTMFTFYFSDKPLGASTAFAGIAGMLGNLVSSHHVSGLKYYQDNKPKVNWGVMLLVGVVLGAFIAAWHGNELTGEWLPPMWAARFGEDSLPLRLGAALVGGVLMAFGARLAGGCTSGHGISGALQLSVGSWIALVFLFASGVATAMLIFH